MKVIGEVMQAISKASLSLNHKKCQYDCKKVSFYGMIYEADVVRPDLSKVEALDYDTRPQNRSELVRFLCMIQSNA